MSYSIVFEAGSMATTTSSAIVLTTQYTVPAGVNWLIKQMSITGSAASNGGSGGDTPGYVEVQINGYVIYTISSSGALPANPTADGPIVLPSGTTITIVCAADSSHGYQSNVTWLFSGVTI